MLPAIGPSLSRSTVGAMDAEFTDIIRNFDMIFPNLDSIIRSQVMDGLTGVRCFIF
jgi:hypothetical protein